MDRAYQQHPGRFVHGPPRIPLLPERGLDQPRGRSDRDRPHSFVIFSLERLIFIDRFRLASMSGKGDNYDKAVPESFFATLEFELVMTHDWHTREEARRAIFRYIETWYNRKRQNSTLGYVSPAEYEAQLPKAA